MAQKYAKNWYTKRQQNWHFCPWFHYVPLPFHYLSMAAMTISSSPEEWGPGVPVAWLYYWILSNCSFFCVGFSPWKLNIYRTPPFFSVDHRAKQANFKLHILAYQRVAIVFLWYTDIPLYMGIWLRQSPFKCWLNHHSSVQLVAVSVYHIISPW